MSGDDPTRPPFGGSTLPPNVAQASSESAALVIAVHNYLVINKLGPPIDAAAFGVACGELMMALNISLSVAALLLRTELERRGVVSTS